MSQMPQILSRDRAARFYTIIGLALLQAGCLAVTAFSVRHIFGDLHGSDPAGTSLIPLWAILLSGVGVAGARVIERSLAESMGQDYAADIRSTLFKCLSHRDMSDLSGKRQGSLSLRFVGDLTAIKGWVSQGLTRLVSAVIVLLCGAVTIIFLNQDMAGAVLIPVVLACLVIAISAPHLADPERRVRSRRAKLAADMSERAPAAPALRLMGRLRRELALMQRRAEALKSAAIIRIRRRALVRSVVDVASGLITAWVLWIALTQDLNPADAAGMLAAAGLMGLPLRDLATVADRRYAWVVARSKCEQVLNKSRATHNASRPETSENGKIGRGKIRISGFQTEQIAPFSSTFTQGDFIALTGAWGSGKSTLLRCLAGLDRPIAGTLTIGRHAKGAHKGEGKAAKARSSVAFLGSETPILAGTLRRALTMGLKHPPTDDDILAIAQSYGLGPFLARVGTLDHVICEGGRDLSSGERWAVLFTRAALNRPSLILIDDLDSLGVPTWLTSLNTLRQHTSATVIASLRDTARAEHADHHWSLKEGHLTKMPRENKEREDANIAPLRAATA